MMKIVLSACTLICLFLGQPFATAQTGNKVFPDQLTEDERSAKILLSLKVLAARQAHSVISQKKGLPSLLSCDTLTTTYVGGNGQSGNMFDITAINPVTISYFDCHVNGSGYIKVYYRSGTFVGSEANPNAWTLTDSLLVSSAGPNVPTQVLIPVNVAIGAGQTFGFYITGNNSGAGLAYNNGTAIGNVFSSNADIQIKEGTGNVYPFGQTFSPRVWNGTVHYCDSGSVQSPSANFIGDTLIICAGDSVAFTDLSAFSPSSWSWTFAGGNPATSTVQNPVVTYTAGGTFSVSLTATNSSGNNTLVKSNYVRVLTNIGAPPVTEDFESAVFPPANFYLIDAGGNGVMWNHDTTASGYGFGNSSISFNNFIADMQGARDQFRTEKVNLATMAVPTLYFDVAYEPFNTTNWSDTLVIYASTDCGKTFTSLYSKGGLTLSTTGDTSSAEFIPTPSDWRTDSVDLSSLVGQTDVIFVFENRGWFGNKLYIDHINLGKKPLPYPNFTASPKVICPGDTVQFTDQSSQAVTYSWNFPGGIPATSTQVNPAVTYSASGLYGVTLTVSNAAGSNSVTITNYVNVLASLGSAAVLEDFEGAAFPPAVIYLLNSGNDLNVWAEDSAVSGYGIGLNSIRYDNYTVNATGTYDAFVTKPMDFTNSGTAPYMLFDVAYAPYDATFLDSLNCYASSDCGKTYTQVYSKGGSVLATAAANTGAFVPGPTEWRTDTVDLSAFAGMPDVSVKFENHPGFGNILYVDNIHIVNGTGIGDLSQSVDVSLYPNPMRDVSRLTIRGAEGGHTVILSDLTGRPVQILGRVPSHGSAEIRRNGLAPGVYLIQALKNDIVIRTVKLVVQ